MARRAATPQPQPANLSVEQMQRGIERLRRRVQEVEAFDPSQVRERFAPEVAALETAIADTLDKVFGHDTHERGRFDVGSLDQGPISMMEEWARPDFRPYLVEGKARVLVGLNAAIRALGEEIEERGTYSAPEATLVAAPQAERSRKVFIVHGRSEGPREAVARYLSNIGFTPIILHEQANQSRTVIEKIEANRDVGFAVVLLTPDDEGRLKGGELKPRARQNVILELGYFIAHLGRQSVCAFVEGELEIPSDWLGVMIEPFDAGWKQKLARELEAAEFEIDWRKAMLA